MQWKIPLADLAFDQQETAAVLRVLESKWLTMGGETAAFEQEFADFVGAKHALALSSCTAALHLACVAHNLQPGDEVILPALTFVATANAVRYTGATPVFADIKGVHDLNISPASIEEKITKKTKGIIVVHYAGYPCDMDVIKAIAERHDLFLIEDAAHAVGASINTQRVGTFGDAACFSFFSNKNMATGEGGMLTTNDDGIAERVKRLRSHGMTTLTWDRHKGHAWSYDVVDMGFNYRIDEIRAAMGRVQLKKLPEHNQRRETLTKYYHESLNQHVPELEVPFGKVPAQSAYHIMPVILPEKIDRKQFMDHLKGEGIQTSIHYPPIYSFSNYLEDYDEEGVNLPVTDAVGFREVTLPLYPDLTFEQIDTVVSAMQSAFAEQRKTGADTV